MIKRSLAVFIMVMTVLIIGQSVAMAIVPDTTFIRLWPEYNDEHVSFLEAVQLSPLTTLPAEVKIAIPKGSSITWVGELLNQEDPSADPQAVYKVNPKDDYDEVVFTLTKSNVGQVEAYWDGLKTNDENRVLNLDWTQRYETKQVVFEFREPSQASDVKLTPPAAKSDTTPGGIKVHETAPLKLAVGQKQNFQVTYKRSINTPTVGEQQSQTQPQGAPEDAFAQSTSQTNNIITLIVIAVIAGIFIIVIYRAKMRSAESQNSRKSQTESRSLGVKLLIAAIVMFIAVIGYGLSTTAVKTSQGIPTGNNCEENVAYLQAGVDKYKEAFGAYPTDLSQLMETKDGKGPFVQTINLECPTDHVPYVVVGGVVQQAPSPAQ